MTRRPNVPPKGKRDEWGPYSNIAAMRKLGFTVAEISGFTVQQMITLSDLSVPDAVKYAMQDDIDKLLG